ncbi:MAG: hypothetical protein II401_03350 [Bacteroidales bacterium]|nr:hypothetical protein [Bacteroidales bacterium]
MIDVIVHGTKGGYKPLYKHSDFSLHYDVRPDVTVDASVGSYAYSIMLKGGDIIASKYIIAKDEIGDSRTGNIAFSIIIPRSESLAGIRIKALLDDLHNAFLKFGYIKDDEITRKTIDDTVITTIIHEYVNTNNRANLSNMSSGNADAAYLYYHNEEEVSKLFDWPYQEDYTRYRQVFFVAEKYKDQRNNPLGALKHTANADLSRLLAELEYYKLVYSSRDGIELKIKNNENVLVEAGAYLKKDSYLIGQFVRKYYEPIIFKGTLTNLENTIISILKDTATINYPKEDKWIKERIEIKFNVIDEDDNIYNNAIIERTDSGKHYTIRDSFMVEGSEIGKKIDIKVYPENTRSYVEDSIRPWEECIKTIICKKQKNISYTIKDYNGNELERGNYNLRVVETKTGKDLATAFIKEGENSIFFIGNQNINKEWAISVDGGQYGSISIPFTPSNTKHLDLKLKKIKQEIIVNTPIINNPRTYGINAGKHGDYINPTATSVYEAIDNVRAHFGWKIDRDETEREFNDNPSREITIRYKKAWNYFLTRWWFYVSTIILLLIVLLIPTISGNSEKDSVIQEINGDKITIAQLNKYNADYCQATDDNQSEGFVGIFKKAFGRDKSQLCSTIDKALSSLTCLNEGRISEYKDFTNDNTHQSKSCQIEVLINNYREKKQVIDTLNKYFKAEDLSNTTIERISHYIADMGKIAEYDNQISKISNSSDCNKHKQKINESDFDDKKHFNNYKNEVLKRLDHKNKEIETIVKEKEKAAKEKQEANEAKKKAAIEAKNKRIKECKEYLRGEVLSTGGLNNYLRENISEEINNSINLCLNFWEVFNKDGVGSTDFINDVTALRNKIANDSNIGTSSKLYNFLNELCINQNAQNKIKGIKQKEWPQITTLQQLIDKSK